MPVVLMTLPRAGNLLRLELIPGQSIEAALAAYKTLAEEEIPGAAAFIRACLRLDSSERATAKDLQLHPWLRIHPRPLP
jgi:serine/threonine-protein kinase SRPK3